MTLQRKFIIFFSLSVSHRFAKKPYAFPFCYKLKQRQLRASKCRNQVALLLLCQWECPLVDREQAVISKRFTWCVYATAFFFQRILIDNQFGVPRQSTHWLKLILTANKYHFLLISTTNLFSCIQSTLDHFQRKCTFLIIPLNFRPVLGRFLIAAIFDFTFLKN